MNDDLIQRLRRSMVPLEWTGLGHEAADEIERLQAQIEALQAAIDGKFTSYSETAWKRDDWKY